jgi:quinol-cytochrome oxidoreductase complex cytochrome b subunit
MSTHTRTVLVWAPRILGFAVCLFLSLFALDAFGSGKTVAQALPDFAVHIAPMAILAGVVAVSFKWELVGSFIFTGLSAAYAYFARSHPSWILAVSGPLVIVGILFFMSWLDRRQRTASA